MKKVLRRTVAGALALLALSLAAWVYVARQPDPRRDLARLHPTSSEVRKQESWFNNNSVTTYIYQFRGNAAFESLASLKRDLIGQPGWRLRASGTNYAFFGKADPGTSQAYWFLTRAEPAQATLLYSVSDPGLQIFGWNVKVHMGSTPSRKAPVLKPSVSNTFPLVNAAMDDDLPRVKAILHSGTTFSRVELCEVLQWVLRRARSYRVAELLIKNGADPNFQEMGSTLLEDAATSGRPEAVRFLCAHGARLPTGSKSPLLRLANVESPVDIFEGFGGESVIYDGGWLSDEGWRNAGAVAEVLIAAGLRLDDRDLHGRTALHLAALNGNARLVEVLLRHGADRNAKDENGLTPKQLAVIKHNNDWRYVVKLSDTQSTPPQ